MSYAIFRWESEDPFQCTVKHLVRTVTGYRKARQFAAYQLLKYKFKSTSLIECVWFEVRNIATQQVIYKTGYKYKEKS